MQAQRERVIVRTYVSANFEDIVSSSAAPGVLGIWPRQTFCQQPGLREHTRIGFMSAHTRRVAEQTASAAHKQVKSNAQSAEEGGIGDGRDKRTLWAAKKVEDGRRRRTERCRPWPEACWFVSPTAVCLNLRVASFLIDSSSFIAGAGSSRVDVGVGGGGLVAWHLPSVLDAGGKALMVS